MNDAHKGHKIIVSTACHASVEATRYVLVLLDTPTANKILFALRWAGPRLLFGMVGTWCAIGPFILISAASGVRTAMLFLLLLLCYAIVFMICFRLRWITLGELVWETGLALCFIILGQLTSEMIGVFSTIKSEMTPFYTFTGFFIAELIKPKDPIKATGEILNALFCK
jgi:hypothetical protein